MKALISIDKTFDDGRQLAKEWQDGDFLEFFKEEGEYLDRLCKIAQEQGNPGDSFEVCYTVKVTV